MDGTGEIVESVERIPDSDVVQFIHAIAGSGVEHDPDDAVRLSAFAYIPGRRELLASPGYIRCCPRCRFDAIIWSRYVHYHIAGPLIIDTRTILHVCQMAATSKVRTRHFRAVRGRLADVERQIARRCAEGEDG